MLPQHTTKIPNVGGYLDSWSPHELSGWSFHMTYGVLPVRLCINQTDIYESVIIERRDVCNGYNTNAILKCGWKFNFPYSSDMEIPSSAVVQILYENQWQDLFNVRMLMFYDHLTASYQFAVKSASAPSFLVADNIYENPDEVRDFALAQLFRYSPAYHKGQRTVFTFRTDILKKKFEQLLGWKITNWDHYGINGVFQTCKVGDPIVYHTDGQQYAGVLFLTPDAPPNAGTSLYRSRITHKMKLGPGSEYGVVFQKGHLDPTDFEVVDVVGNVYNRVVLFDSKTIHAASSYFGDCLENGRLFQLFFFDLGEPLLPM
jgi:hypothetical protein